MHPKESLALSAVHLQWRRGGSLCVLLNVDVHTPVSTSPLPDNEKNDCHYYTGQSEGRVTAYDQRMQHCGFRSDRNFGQVGGGDRGPEHTSKCVCVLLCSC